MFKVHSKRTQQALGISIFLLSVAVGHAERPDEFVLPEQAKGQAAITALEKAGVLEKVARAHGMGAEKLKQNFRNDSTLTVDRLARLFHIEKTVTADGGGAEGDGSAAGDPVFGPEDAFSLNSRPGSSKTIYLDFDGETISGTAWNSTMGQSTLTLAPYDFDGNPASFSDSEKNRIINIWRRVAEDFAPFEVNVTTQFPGQAAISRTNSSDQEYGTNVVITRAIPVCSGSTNCGGVAYYSAFGNYSDSTKPALVFFDKLGGGDEKYTAEAISHEAGHNLDLQHDGTTSGDAYYGGHGSGATGWAPIMGVGYYKELTQWSKGEYSGANNQQDDYQAMANRGLVFRADDYGNSRSTAYFLNQGTTFGATGVIETRTDRDFFGFNAGAGTLEIDVTPPAGITNLDVLVTVYNASGQELAHANETGRVDASLSVSLPADGVYYVAVEGTGNGSAYSDYGSLGQYTLVGSIANPNGNTPPTAIASASPSNGYAPLVVQFNGSSSEDSDGYIVSYHWDFKDGSTSTATNPSHTFTTPGIYSVSLAVTDDGGLIDSDTVEITVTKAPNQPPVAVADVNSTSGKIPFTANFSASRSSDSDGTIVSYLWNFADANNSTSGFANPSFTYTTPGTYVVTLTVTDNEGLKDSDTTTLTIADDPLYLPKPSFSAQVSNGVVFFTWSSSGRETQFTLFRRTVTESGKGKNRTTSYGNWVSFKTLTGTATEYADSSFVEGQKYQAYIRAQNSSTQADSETVDVVVRTSKKGGGNRGPK